eukprot:3707726-Rhodomonas_salina.1
MGCGSSKGGVVAMPEEKKGGSDRKEQEKGDNADITIDPGQGADIKAAPAKTADNASVQDAKAVEASAAAEEGVAGSNEAADGGEADMAELMRMAEELMQRLPEEAAQELMGERHTDTGTDTLAQGRRRTVIFAVCPLFSRYDVWHGLTLCRHQVEKGNSLLAASMRRKMSQDRGLGAAGVGEAGAGAGAGTAVGGDTGGLSGGGATDS